MKIYQRLLRLEQQVGDRGCLVCRHRRGRTALLVAERLPDGTSRALGVGPAPCVRCEDVPERMVRLVKVVVTAETESRLAFDAISRE